MCQCLILPSTDGALLQWVPTYCGPLLPKRSCDVCSSWSILPPQWMVVHYGLGLVLQPTTASTSTQYKSQMWSLAAAKLHGSWSLLIMTFYIPQCCTNMPQHSSTHKKQAPLILIHKESSSLACKPTCMKPSGED